MHLSDAPGSGDLKKLHDTGYLDRFRPVRAFGRAEWIYRVGAQGYRTLAAQRLVPGRRGYTPAVITSIGYAEHDLQLAALVLHLADKASHHSSGGLIERMPFSWQGPRSGRIDIDEGENFERSAAAKLAPGTRLHVEQSRRGYLEPDATLIGGSGAERWAVLIEYDRTERPHKQIDRLRRYDWWLLEGWREAHFATHAIPPVVIYLTARSGPLRGLIEAADQTFSAWHGRRDAGPREGTHPAREGDVHQPRTRSIGRPDHGMRSQPATGAARVPKRVLAEVARIQPRLTVRRLRRHWCQLSRRVRLHEPVRI